MTVYAKYDVAINASYRVNYWYQNATDELSISDDEKTYTLFDTETKMGEVNRAPSFDVSLARDEV